MSSGFSRGYPDFYTAAGGTNGRSMTDMNNPQGPYRSPLAGILSDQSSQIVQRRPDFTGKRSLFEYQQRFQQQQQLGIYLRNVKQRANYQQQANSPISPLSPPVDFSANSVSPDISSISSSSSSSISTRYGLPIFQPLRQQPGGMISASHLSGNPFQNLVQNRVGDSEKKMMNRLQEIEKQLLDDNDEEQGDAASVVTNSEWSETIQSLIGPGQKPISPSPTSSSSSCSSSSASPPVICPKQSLTEAASAISDGKINVAVDTITRVSKVSNSRGTSEQRLMAYMVSALRSRLNPTEYPPPVGELYGKDHTVSVQMLYEISPCFKLGFMAANLAILEAISGENSVKLHVIDFDIGQGSQYLHLLHALAAKKSTGNKFMSLKITTFLDYSTNCDEARLNVVGDGLDALAKKVGVSLCFKVMNLKISELNPEGIGLEADEVLAVNLAFRLFKLPDESVTTENLRDELLRRVKGLSPKVVTVVEQEMNANTAPFVARVTEACGYYGALFESLDATATVPGDNPERVRIEECLSRKMANSVACEGRDRVERCEVFGKWRARMGMAGFEAKRMSLQLADSVRAELNSGARGNPGFTVKEEAGGICFGWMGRTLTVASAWC